MPHNSRVYLGHLCARLRTHLARARPGLPGLLHVVLGCHDTRCVDQHDLAEDSPFRTYMDINLKPLYPDNPQVPDAPIDIYTDHPWKHPGSARLSPCGIGGGDPRGCFDGSFPPCHPVPGRRRPQRPGRPLLPFPDPKMTIW